MSSTFNQQAFFLANIDLNVSDSNATMSNNKTFRNGPYVTSPTGLSSPSPVDFLKSTPPSITRVLTYTSPIVHLFSYFLSLVTWTSGNPSESCLLVAAWWTLCLYPKEIIIYGTHSFILAWIGWRWIEKRKSERLGKPSSALKSTSQLDLDRTVLEIHKISEKLSSFHTFINSIRSHVDWTNPTQTQKVIRGLIYSYPIWLVLTYFVPLTWIFINVGTFGLVWHSPWLIFIRYSLMQSALFRGFYSLIFVYVLGEDLTQQGEGGGFSVGALIRKAKEQQKKLASKKTNNNDDENKTSSDLIFRFVIYENQRWWLGLDWTTNLFLNERPAWSDEYNDPTSPKSSFQLPPPSSIIIKTPEDPKILISKTMEWQWDGSDWWIDYDGDVDKDGWEYADNRWKGFSSKSGFRRYTRRRKWVRTARLVETIEKIDNDDNDNDNNNNNNNNNNNKVTNDDNQQIKQITEISEDFETISPPPYSLSSNSSSSNRPLPLIPRKPDGKFDIGAISPTKDERQDGNPIEQNSL